MAKGFEITSPLPARGSAVALRQQIVEHLVRVRPKVGDRFHSDLELARISQLSRPTVRRAMDDLERDGWIERRPGIGTFIGPRAGLAVDPRPEHAAARDRDRTIRLALVMSMVNDFAHGWYAAGIIAGIDNAGESTGVTCELLGDQHGDGRMISRRLAQSRPDVIAFAAPALRHLNLLVEARRLNIPCIGTGTLLSSVGAPAVCEDSAGAARIAVNHLASLGHRRIGLILSPLALPWVFHRRQGYLEGLGDAGIEPDESLTLWLGNPSISAADPTDDARLREPQSEVLRKFLDREHPTALLVTGWAHMMQALAPLVASGRVRVPQELSVVTFDQHPNTAAWLGGVAPATLVIPLGEMGRRLAQMARAIHEGREVAGTTLVPCDFTPGQSTAPPPLPPHAGA
ncbi:MAG TPA: GntR family transcriptional regulator [Tepidisphaeraceae bacterium]|nr:GntR family transcriptional regulator [Tepidisphaeraceae bacterium]